MTPSPTQRAILLAGSAAILLALLFPPFTAFGENGLRGLHEIHFLFAATRSGNLVVNTTLLLIEIGGIALATILAALALTPAQR